MLNYDVLKQKLEEMNEYWRISSIDFKLLSDMVKSLQVIYEWMQRIQSNGVRIHLVIPMVKVLSTLSRKKIQEPGLHEVVKKFFHCFESQLRTKILDFKDKNADCISPQIILPVIASYLNPCTRHLASEMKEVGL